MAPSQSLPNHASQSKKQQSISSFFTAKSNPTAKPATPHQSNGAIDGNTGPLTIDSEEESTEIDQRSSKRSRRVLDVDDSDVENEEPFPNKRQKSKTSEKEKRTPAASRNELPRRLEGSVQPRNPKSNVVETTSKDARTNAASDRTSKYLFSSSGVEDNDEQESEDVRRLKEKLHHKFVQKLVRPDSIAEIKRRNHFITDETADAENGVDDDDAAEEDEMPKVAPKGKKGVASTKKANKLTPLEVQVLDIKKHNPKTLLVVEVGYKFRFFGEDARIAAKELGIVCIPGKYRYDEHQSEAHLNRFASASIPVHRLHVHVKRLVAAGHKVGVVRQLETAALKAAGDNRNAPFIRKLTNVYTKGTYIDDPEGLDGPLSGPSGGSSSTGYLLCLTESNAKGWGNDEKVHVGLVAVQPATGDIIYDDFEDRFMRSEIESRLLHIAPCEFLIVGELSRATEKLIEHLSESKSNVLGDRARVERVAKPKTMAAQAYSHISSFYAGKVKSSAERDDKSTYILDKVHELSEHVTVCLSALITSLTEYGIEHVFDLTRYFQPFSARTHMLLNGNTLTSLEIYRNQTDYSEKGSLFWTLDRTKTRFGQRLLRTWVGRPLLARHQLEERIDAVQELNSGEKVVQADKLKHLLSQVKGDLEKSLIRIFYKRCTRPELLGVLQTLQRISAEYVHVKTASDSGFTSRMIQDAIAMLPTISGDIISYLDRINPQAAKNDDKYGFFREEFETEEILEQKMGIASAEMELNDHRTAAAEKLRKKKVDYVTVAGIEYLIEVENSQLKNVPASWPKISGTKKVSRFHTPDVIRMMKDRDQHKEALAAACDEAFAALLSEIGTKYQALRDCIQSLATLDCLVSLAAVASQPGYVKPEFTDEVMIEVEQGRHPMVEQLLLDSYVPNNIHLSSKDRALLITGPNMGGKSSYVRQVALISIMGQIGSYVPATSAKLGLLDAVYTRMGAFDNMMAGESTFMVELSETSDILKQASPRSLVILDELGRGTSTHDGVAIAEAVLDYVVRDIKCLTLFITHYQSLSGLARSFEKGTLRNVHMKFEEGDEDGQNITFLYELGDGSAHRSYGLNVARLANVPKPVIDVAAVKSKDLESQISRKKLSGLSKLISRCSLGLDEIELEQLMNGIEQI